MIMEAVMSIKIYMKSFAGSITVYIIMSLWNTIFQKCAIKGQNLQMARIICF